MLEKTSLDTFRELIGRLNTVQYYVEQGDTASAIHQLGVIRRELYEEVPPQFRRDSRLIPTIERESYERGKLHEGAQNNAHSRR